MITDYKKVFPIVAIQDQMMINGNTDITIGFKMMLPEVFTLTEVNYKELHDSFLNVINRLPVGCVFHKLDYFYNSRYKSQFSEKDSFSIKHNKLFYNERPVLRHYCTVYITFSNRRDIQVNPENNSFISNIDYFLGDILGKGKVKEIIELVNATIPSIVNGMNAIPYVVCSRMDNDELGAALYEYGSLSYNRPADKGNADVWSKRLPSVEFEKMALKIGNQYVQVVSLSLEGNRLDVSKKPKYIPQDAFDSKGSLPDKIDVDSSLLFPVGLGFPVDHIVSVSIEIVDKKILKRDIELNTGILNFVSFFASKDVGSKMKAIALLEQNVTEHNFVPCKLSVNIIMNDVDAQRLGNNTSNLSTAFGNVNDSYVWVENYDNANLFFALMPGNIKANYRSIINITGQACTYLIKESHYYSDGSGILYQDRFGNPIYVDLWTLDKIDNRNMVILGPSGSGKSFFNNGLVDQFFYNGHHLVIVDIGYSYKKICDAYNGLFYDSKDLSKFSFNIFICPKDSKGRYQYKVSSSDDAEQTGDQVIFIVSVLTYIWKGSEPKTKNEDAILKDLVNQFYEYVNDKGIFPDLTEFYKYITIYEKEVVLEAYKKFIDFDSLRLQLNEFVSGSYSFLFNSKDNVDLTNERFIVFELEAIKGNEQLKTLVCIIIAQLSINKINLLPLSVRKNLYFDEALDFLKSDLGEFIGYLYRTYRKKNGSVGLAMQNVNFFNGIDETVKESITINTDIVVCLDHSRARKTYPGLVSHLSFTDDGLRLLDGLVKNKNGREFLMRVGSTYKVYRYQVSPETGMLYTTNADDVAALNIIFKKVGNMASAIKIFVQEKGRQLAESYVDVGLDEEVKSEE